MIKSKEEIINIINNIPKDKFIIANAVKLVYFGIFQKLEIAELKISNVLKDNEILSEIKLHIERKNIRYRSKKSIILDNNSKSIIKSHIKQLKINGYSTTEDSYLFPYKENKKYELRTLGNHFNKYFKNSGITFNKLRRSGLLNFLNFSKEEKIKLSRFSKIYSFNKSVTDNVQKSGNKKCKGE